MSTELIVKTLSLKHFDGVGLASANRPATVDFYEKWLKDGLHGDMNYLKAYLGRKTNPQELLPKAKSWIALSLHYDSQEPLSIDLAEQMKKNKSGWIARYARGGDYHQNISRKHEEIIKKLKELFPDEKFLGCVDVQAVLERDIASQAGLGWFGKNTCLIDQKKEVSFL